MGNAPDRLKTPPEGFSVVHHFSDELVIERRSPKARAWVSFEVTCILGTTAIFIFLDEKDMGLTPGFVLFFAAAVSSVLYNSYSILFHCFGMYVYHLKRNEFTISKNLFGWSSSRALSREEIRRIEQTEDWYENRYEDAPHAWGLHIVTSNRNVSLWTRRHLHESDWMGEVLSNWFNVDFISARIRN